MNQNNDEVMADLSSALTKIAAEEVQGKKARHLVNPFSHWKIKRADKRATDSLLQSLRQQNGAESTTDERMK